MKFLQQYKNLSKEIYVLFFGRIVTSMGSLIWPLLTLILKNKLGYNATTIATLTMAMSILQFPMLLLGGKLADTLNRKKIIIVCDLVTVVSYIICGLLPLSNYSIALFYIAGVFATIEGPSYDALVADLSDSESREKAYSLQYLGMNLGLVLSPTIGGLLFENYLWLAFILTGLATLSSTILIILFIKRLSVEKGNVSAYEEKRENESVFRILRERKTLITTFLSRLMDVRKILIGESLIVLGLFGYRFVQGAMVPYFILMILFTIGEVFNTLGHQPYMTRRIPSTHWGRVNSFVNTVNGLFAGVGNIFIGKIVDVKGYDMAWLAVGVLGAVALILVVMLNLVDKRQFGLLYGGKTQ